MFGLRSKVDSARYQLEKAFESTDFTAQVNGDVPHLEQLEVQLTGHPFDPFQARTEDVRFSPDGSRIAIISTAGKFMLFNIDTNARPVQAELVTTFVSSDIVMPHGIDWVDDEHVVIANRRAGLAFFHVPRLNQFDAETQVEPITNVQSSWFGAPGEMRDLRERKVVTGASSVRLHDGALIVASNYKNTITRHEVLPGPTCADGELVAQQPLEIPEGANISPDGKWLSIADHDHNRVLIFRTGESEPVASLTDEGMTYPHGTTFDDTGTIILASDAGTRNVHLFYSPDGDWSSDHTSVASSIVGVAKAVFNRVQRETASHVRALEGGTKGIDVSPDGKVVLTTCRGQTVRAFALKR